MSIHPFIEDANFGRLITVESARFLEIFLSSPWLWQVEGNGGGQSGRLVGTWVRDDSGPGERGGIYLSSAHCLFEPQLGLEHRYPDACSQAPHTSPVLGPQCC